MVTSVLDVVQRVPAAAQVAVGPVGVLARAVVLRVVLVLAPVVVLAQPKR